MPTITVANSKGGSGKSVTVLALASEMHSAGTDVCIIDTDPQLTAFSWFERRGHKEDLPVYNAGQLARDVDVVGLIETYSKQHEYCLIDVQGFNSLRLQYAVSRAHYWLIPMNPTSMDAKNTSSLLANDMLAILTMRGDRSIPHRVLFTRANSRGNSLNAQHVINETATSVGVFDSKMYELNAFQAMHLYGMTLAEIEQARVANAVRARECTQAVLAELLNDLSAPATAS